MARPLASHRRVLTAAGHGPAPHEVPLSCGRAADHPTNRGAAYASRFCPDSGRKVLVLSCFLLVLSARSAPSADSAAPAATSVASARRRPLPRRRTLLVAKRDRLDGCGRPPSYPSTVEASSLQKPGLCGGSGGPLPYPGHSRSPRSGADLLYSFGGPWRPGRPPGTVVSFRRPATGPFRTKFLCTKPGARALT